MLLAKIEMYLSKNPTMLPRLRYWGVTIASAAVALVLGNVNVAVAAAPGVPLLADADVGDTLTQAVQALGADAQRVTVKPQAGVAACDPKLGASPRLALLVHVPSRSELDRCGQSSQVNLIEIGRQAVALVVPANSPVWSIDAGALFRALGQNGGDTKAKTWSELDPSFPKLPIGILLPPSNSRTQRLFNSLIMDAGCDRAATARAPFDVKSRTSFCSTLRSDIPAPQRQDGVAAVASWSAAAPPGQIAVVSVAELTQLEGRVAPLMIGGALPTAANVESGRYPAADKIFLLIVVPQVATEVQRVAARDLAFDLLAEKSIGPAGTLAPAGLMPLPPTNRVAARSQAIAFLESR